MISGGCPYTDCDGPIILPDPPEGPMWTAYYPSTCEHCGRRFWSYLSRWNPWSMTEAAFLNEYAVDDTERTIRKLSAETTGEET